MRYLIGLPICLVVISGLLWLTAGRSLRVTAQDGAPAPEAAEPVAGETRGQTPFRPLLETAAIDPITIHACTLAPIQEQNVASQIDGVIGEVCVALGGKIDKGTRLAQLDDQKLRLQVELLQIKAQSTSAERIAQAMFDEADAKVKYAERANTGLKNSVPELELKTYQAQRERFEHEIKKAREDREEAGKELEKTRFHLQMHRITSALSGEVVKIFKKPGETVKQGEPLFRLARVDRLLVEGFCKAQHAPALRPGQRVLAHAELEGAQLTALIGHTAAVNCVAIAPDGKLLASAGDDGNVILWAWPSGIRLATLPHPGGVHAVDVVKLDEQGQTNYLIASGCEDRLVRVWSYSVGSKLYAPRLELAGHEGAVRTVSLSSDGRFCVSGGEDRRLARWDMRGNERQPRWIHGLGAWKQTAHQGTITRVHCAPDSVVISTGSDNVHKVWQVSDTGNKLIKTHRGRSGDVPRPGISGDGTRLLLDHGDELRLLSRDEGAVLGTLHHPKNVRFEEFAGYAPSQRLLLTASADGRLQLWKTPTPGDDKAALPDLGGHEVRQYALPKAAQARCGVFAPDESVFFTGGTDRAVRVWTIPPASEWAPREAKITYIGSELEAGTDLVRIQAELDNPAEPARWWRPGTFVHLKAFPIHP